MRTRLGQGLAHISEGWQRFFFAPTATWTVGIVRIAWGFLAALWAISAFADVAHLYGPAGVRPEHPTRELAWGLLRWFPSEGAAYVVMSLIVVGGLAAMVGFRSRLATFITWICLLAVARRTPEITNSGDVLLRNIGFFLMFAPTGSALSLDRWLSDRSTFWQAPLRAPWALRMIQIQMSVLYLYSTWAKLRGDPWIEGTAVGDTWRAGQFVRFEVPMFVYDSVILSNLATFGTLIIEASLIALVWDRRWRPWVLSAGVVLHLGIELTMAVGFFSLAVFICYLAFIPADTTERLVGRFRGLLARSSNQRVRALAGSSRSAR